jgi:lipopolysaccharide export system permease protein
MRILDRYIVAELVGPFLFGIAVVILLFEGSLLFPLLNVIAEKHAPLLPVARFLMLKAPWLVVWAAPVAMLFASALTITRMGRDNEITCMRASGLSLRRIFAPILVVGLAASAVSFVVGERVVPRAEKKANRIINEIYLSQSIPDIQPDVFFRTENYCFYVGAAQKKGPDSRDVLVQNILVYRLPEGSGFPEVMTAKHGESRGLTWEFRDGWLAQMDKEGFIKHQQHFESHTMDLSRAVQDFWMGSQQSQELSLKELQTQIKQFGSGGLPTESIETEYHLRLSLPLSCLVFALLSAPLALRFARAGSFAGLLLSVVLGFLYYNTIFLGKILGMNGVLPPALAGWMQNILFGTLGLFFIATSE